MIDKANLDWEINTIKDWRLIKMVLIIIIKLGNW